MREAVLTTKLSINQSYMSFILPLGYDKKRKEDFAKTLRNNGFDFFQIDEDLKEKNIYGEDIVVDVKELEQYFLPYVENKLFPVSLNEKGFHRFTASIMESFEFKIKQKNLSFFIQSADIILGPFGIAFITVRVQLEEETELSDALDFMQHFRAVESKLEEERGAKVVCPESESLLSVHDFLFERLFPFMTKFIVHEKKLNRYFGSLPYFKDERMYVYSFLFSQEGSVITNDQLYRMGSLDGRASDKEYLYQQIILSIFVVRLRRLYTIDGHLILIQS